MSLIKCPECGKEVSTFAITCPNCGCPIKKIVDDEALTAMENIQNHKVQCKRCGAWNPVGTTYCQACNGIINGYDYIYTQQKTNGIKMASKQKPMPFWGNTWFVILLMFTCCFPLGILFMWK